MGGSPGGQEEGRRGRKGEGQGHEGREGGRGSYPGDTASERGSPESRDGPSCKPQAATLPSAPEPHHCTDRIGELEPGGGKAAAPQPGRAAALGASSPRCVFSWGQAPEARFPSLTGAAGALGLASSGGPSPRPTRSRPRWKRVSTSGFQANPRSGLLARSLALRQRWQFWRFVSRAGIWSDTGERNGPSQPHPLQRGPRAVVLTRARDGALQSRLEAPGHRRARVHPSALERHHAECRGSGWSLCPNSP